VECEAYHASNGVKSLIEVALRSEALEYEDFDSADISLDVPVTTGENSAIETWKEQSLSFGRWTRGCLTCQRCISITGEDTHIPVRLAWSAMSTEDEPLC